MTAQHDCPSDRVGVGVRLPRGRQEDAFLQRQERGRKSGIHYGSSKTKPVASFSPNSLGLYDMSGNVFEWTCSAYTKSYDGSEQKCSVSAEDYSFRGGSWANDPRVVRSAYRFSFGPSSRGGDLGFRLARD